MKLTFIIKIVLLFILSMLIFSEGYSQEKKSPENYDKQKARVDFLNKQSVKYLQSDFPKAIKTAESALKIAEDINYPQGEADALYNSANSIASQSSVGQDMAVLKKALKIYRKINDQSKVAKTLNRISLQYYHIQHYTKAYNHTTDALKIYEKLSENIGIADSYLMIGKIYNVWNMTNNAEEAYETSKQIYHNVPFPKGVADVLIQQGNLAALRGQKIIAQKCYSNAIYLYKKANCFIGLSDSYNVMSAYHSDYDINMKISHHYMDKAIKISESMKDSSRLASFLTHKSHLYSLENNIEFSLQYDLKALEIRRKINQQLAVGSSYINLGSDYILLKDFKKAEENLLLGYSSTTKTGLVFYARKAAHMLHGLYRMTNQPDKALLYLDSAYKLTLIINQEEKLHQKSLVDAERKLRIKEQKISQLEIRRSTSFRYMLWTIILLGASSGIVFFYLYRAKKKDNQMLLLKKKELEDSEFRYRNLIDTATDFIYSIDSNGCFISINPAFELLTGYLVSDYLGKSYETLVYNDDLNMAITTFEKSKKGIPQEPYELRIMKKAGDYFYGEFTSKELIQDGRIIGEFGIVRDITSKKIAEDALKASEERYRIFINSTDDMAFLKDDKFRYMIVNKPYVDFFNKQEQFILGKTDFELMPMEAAESCNRTDQLAAKSNTVAVNEEEAFGRIYETHKFRVSLGNELYGIGGYIRDITERKYAETALKKSKELYSTLIETMNEGLIQVDNDDRIEFVNNGICNIFGYQPEELIGKIGYETIIYSDDKNVIESENKSRLAGNREKYEVRGIKKTGEVIWLNISGSPILDEQGNTIGSVGLISDITDRKKTENELITAKEKAEESERLKSSFLANMSHELRTPMVGILGFSQLLGDVEDLEKAKEMGEIINSSGKRLMDTLNMILDLARIEAGESKVELSELDLVQAIQDIMRVFDAIAKTKNLVLQCYTKYDSLLTYSSPKIIASVLNNLINNAIKFTNVGSIIVSLEVEQIDVIKYAKITVADTGIGISSKDIDLIFTEFRQASEGLDRSHEGTGLGLTLCKKYIEMLGGKISVESSVGVGTVFTILIPDTNQSSLAESIDVTTSDQKFTINTINIDKNFNLSILVVDDDPTSIYLVDRILSDQFYIDSVNNSADAIEKVKENQYSLILMDINLGKSKNGLFTTAEIRKLENYKNTPIIAMTAYAMLGDREEFLAKGCTGYLSKPFTKQDLINSVFEYI